MEMTNEIYRGDSRISQEEYDEQDARIASILGDDEVPVDDKSLARYRKYLERSLTLPCRLTGIEDFAWEEFYVFGPGNKKEYEKLKKNRPSYTDEFDFIGFDTYKSEEEGLFVKVSRVSDTKQFILPLAELKTVDKNSEKYQLLDDFSVWFVNSR
jgi:hypothetical protein